MKKFQIELLKKFKENSRRKPRILDKSQVELVEDFQAKLLENGRIPNLEGRILSEFVM